MKKYIYNPDPRVIKKTDYDSFEELCESSEWKSDNAKYYFNEHIPAYCEGFDFTVLTFDTIEELLEHFSKKDKNCLFKLLYEKNESCATLMVFKWEKANENKEDSDGHREAYLKKNLGDRWQDYNWWWVVGYVGRKDGTCISKKECIEKRCD